MTSPSSITAGVRCTSPASARPWVRILGQAEFNRLTRWLVWRCASVTSAERVNTDVDLAHREPALLPQNQKTEPTF